jgi:predicted enzyme related to lactoylglutathione lyase
MSTHGHFAWFELVTPDVGAGTAFWSEVAGLQVSHMDMGGFQYPMLGRSEHTFAGVVTPQMPGVPPHWLAYWGVDDVDARTAMVAGAGGKVVVPPADIPTVGRFSIVADPHGATVALFKSANAGMPEPAQPAIAWMELWSKDAPVAVKFYQEVLGLEAQETTMPNGKYHLLLANGKQVAGAMTSPLAAAPPMWLPYLTVDDADEALVRVRNHGGAVHSEVMAVPGIGRFGVVADRQQAVLGLLTPG